MTRTPAQGPDHSLYRAFAAAGARAAALARRRARRARVFLYFEYWELDPPTGSIYDKRHDGALGGLFPNYKVHSQYEYGNRVGIFRVLDLLDRHELPVTVAANAGACEKYPYLVEQFRERGYEFAAHGTFATRMLSSQMSEAEERAAIARLARHDRARDRQAAARLDRSGLRRVDRSRRGSSRKRAFATWPTGAMTISPICCTRARRSCRFRTRPNGTMCR